MDIMTGHINQQNEALEQRRFGRFHFTQEILSTHADVIQKIFSKVIPLNVTFDVTRNLFEVKACSMEFESLEVNSVIPTYHVNVRRYPRNKGGTGHAIYIDFELVEE